MLCIWMAEFLVAFVIGQVERASYVWLPLLPRHDGLGYELLYADAWRPSDFKFQAKPNATAPSLNATLALLNSTGVAEGTPAPGAGIGAGSGSSGSAAAASLEPIGAAAEVTPSTPPEGGAVSDMCCVITVPSVQAAGMRALRTLA